MPPDICSCNAHISSVVATTKIHPKFGLINSIPCDTDVKVLINILNCIFIICRIIVQVQEFLNSAQNRQGGNYVTNHIMMVMGKVWAYHDAGIWFQSIDTLIK